MPTPNEERALALARARLRSMDPQRVARCAGIAYAPQSETGGYWEVVFLNRSYRVSFPDGVVGAVERAHPAPKHATVLLILHYLAEATGEPLAGHWVALREVPGGLLYDKAFRERVEPPLVAAYGANLERLERAARALGGTPIGFGDAAYAFHVLPRLPLAVIMYRGDDEWPPAASVLFDQTAGAYLPTEDLAIVGGVLVGALLKAGS